MLKRFLIGWLVIFTSLAMIQLSYAQDAAQKNDLRYAEVNFKIKWRGDSFSPNALVERGKPMQVYYELADKRVKLDFVVDGNTTNLNKSLLGSVKHQQLDEVKAKEAISIFVNLYYANLGTDDWQKITNLNITIDDSNTGSVKFGGLAYDDQADGLTFTGKWLSTDEVKAKYPQAQIP